MGGPCSPSNLINRLASVMFSSSVDWPGALHAWICKTRDSALDFAVRCPFLNLNGRYRSDLLSSIHTSDQVGLKTPSSTLIRHTLSSCRTKSAMMSGRPSVSAAALSVFGGWLNEERWRDAKDSRGLAENTDDVSDTLVITWPLLGDGSVATRLKRNSNENTISHKGCVLFKPYIRRQ